MAHPNVQQLLASIWYDGLPGFLQMNMVLQFLEVSACLLLLLISSTDMTETPIDFLPAILIIMGAT